MKKDPGNVNQWFQIKEFWITGVLSVLTLVLGIFGIPPFSSSSSGFLNSLIVAFLEIIVGIAIGIARSVSSELEAFERHSASQFSALQLAVAEDNELVKNTLILGDPEVFQDMLRITSCLQQASKSELLYGILRKEIRTKANELTNMVFAEEFPLSKQGSVSPLQEKLQNYLETLSQGNSYVTVSNLNFWSGEEISHPDTFLSFNIDCALTRGVNFERVFLLDNRKFSELDEEEKNILRRHLQSTKDCGDKIKTYVVESEKNFSAAMRKYGNYSVWLSKNSPQLLMTMVYDNEGKFLRCEATKKQADISTLYSRFKELRAQAEPIDVYLQKNDKV